MSKKEPKVAIVHDWLVGYAGGDGIAYLGASKTFDLRGRR